MKRMMTAIFAAVAVFALLPATPASSGVSKEIAYCTMAMGTGGPHVVRVCMRVWYDDEGDRVDLRRIVFYDVNEEGDGGYDGFKIKGPAYVKCSDSKGYWWIQNGEHEENPSGVWEVNPDNMECPENAVRFGGIGVYKATWQPDPQDSIGSPTGNHLP